MHKFSLSAMLYPNGAYTAVMTSLTKNIQFDKSPASIKTKQTKTSKIECDGPLGNVHSYQPRDTNAVTLQCYFKFGQGSKLHRPMLLLIH